jgi:Leucine-rich repeat (LRR) protein
VKTFAELDNFLFYGAINLRRVLLSNNQIAFVGKDTFKKMILPSADPFDITQQRKLEEVDLSNNQLTELEYGTFSQLHTLKILLLRHNNVKLKYGLFPKGLMKLDLSYNNLKDFTLRQLINSNSLEELNLNGNYFGETSIDFIFPEAIFQLMNVYRFELSDCFPCIKRFTQRNIVAQYEREKTHGANIFGISCVYDSERQN